MAVQKPNSEAHTDQPTALSPDDAALATRIRVGDAAAFGELMDAHFNSAARVAYRLLSSRDLAQDAAQKVFTAIWEQRTTFSPTRSIKGYILVAARNQALKDIRHARVEERHEHAVLSVPEGERQHTNDDVALVEDRATLAVLLARLSERRRQAVELRYLEQLSYADIAQVMKISPGAAEQLVIRALEELRRHESLG